MLRQRQRRKLRLVLPLQSRSLCPEDELSEYRLLHSKLTYRVKTGVAGADEALQQLKSNRQMVLDKFRGDKTMAWVPSTWTGFTFVCFLF